MNDERKNKLRDQARALEGRGDVDGAVQLFLRVGSLGEAARALAAAGRYLDAGELLMGSLGVGLDELGGLTGRPRRIAEKAAECFAHAGDTRRAEQLRKRLGSSPPPSPSSPGVRVFKPDEPRVSVGQGTPASSKPADHPRGSPPPERRRREAGWRAAGKSSAAHEKMIQELLAAGKTGQAARVAWEAGRLEDAVRWFGEVDMPYELGMCLADLGRDEEALAQLVRVPVSHGRYRQAAARVIEVALALGVFDFDVDRFVSPFAGEPPKKKAEVDAYLDLAEAYEREGFGDSAIQILERVLVFDPDHQRARKLHRGLTRRSTRQAERRGSRPSQASGGRPRRKDSLPDLPPIDGFAESARGTRRRSSQPRRTSSDAGASPPPPRPSPAPERRPSHAPTASSAPPSSPPANASPSHGAEPSAPAGSPATPTRLVPGAVIANRYRLVKPLGRGGMAVVYRALDLELEQEIALKLMHAEPGSADAWIDRFKQELALARQLTHKNIVRVYDIGTFEGSKLISMELLDGKTLEDMLDAPVPLASGIHYALQVCAGLRAAHDLGVIHRDIKPANLFVTRDGVVKIMDFGVAKAPRGDRRLTAQGALVGTPEYMAPEQVEDPGKVGPSSDLYSLGAVMYEMFTLACPFEHEALMMLLQMVCHQQPEPPRQRNPSIPPALEGIILRLLAKSPAERYESATELARHLRAVAKEIR